MDDHPQVGVDIGGTKLLLTVVHRGGRESRRVPTGRGTGPEFVEREIRRLLSRLEAPPSALGIAVPGLVDMDGGVAGCDTFPRLEDWRADRAFADLGCPVRVVNDAEAALAEETHDIGPDATAAIVMSGTWIGAAFRAHGVPFRGASGWAGELGYVPIGVRDGSTVRLDDLAAGGAVAARLNTDGAGLYEQAMEGNPETLTAITEAGKALGLGLAMLVDLLNPELLVLSGGAFRLPGYREASLESAEQYALPDLWRVCVVRSARAGEETVSLGAIRMAVQERP